MQLLTIDSYGNFVEILESDNVFRKDGSFTNYFRDTIKKAIDQKHDVVLSHDNKLRCVRLYRDERYKRTLAERAVEWLNSPEGKAKLKEAYKRAEKACSNLEAARQIDWSKIHEPMTI